jgi:hypothetical protein
MHNQPLPRPPSIIPAYRASTGINARRSFDPEKFRIIVFDQRDCGRSTGCTGAATTSEDVSRAYDRRVGV